MYITYNHSSYEAMFKQVIEYNYYWERYPIDINNFLKKYEICLDNNKIHKIKTPTRIIIYEGPKFRYMNNTGEIPMTY